MTSNYAAPLLNLRRYASDLSSATDLVSNICRVAGSKSFLDDILKNAQASGLSAAIETRNTPKLFDAILPAFSYQGISDTVARSYMKRNGSATWYQIRKGLMKKPTCPRLRSYWQYHQCRYDKGSGTCAEPDHITDCPLPAHRLRNGRLNQTAYSFFLFVRDLVGRDFVGWIDQQLASVQAELSHPVFDGKLQEALIGPMRNIYGVSDKILAMTLSEILMSADEDRPLWHRAGRSMIAVDTLVDNFLHRTGILATCGREHTYGAACYQSGGCASVLRSIAQGIDARRFNATFPSAFPRFVQHAVWRYCAADGLNICNGNQIDDRKPCQTRHCVIFEKCGRKPIKMTKNQ